MEKRVTIHDIAREAGVSAATVSYVINNKEGQTISEETKNKIWHVINMLNYKPNVFAKNLRSSNSKLIAICSELHGYLEKAEFVNILEDLSFSLRENFDIVFTMPPFGRISNADAIIAYNVSKETFYAIGNQNYIPLIAVNCLVEDKLFFQVTIDYQKLKKEADEYFKNEYCFVCLPPTDSLLKEEIQCTFHNVIFVENGADLQTINIPNVLTIHGLIAEFFKGQPVNLLYKDLYFPTCEQVANCIHKALSREAFDIHSYKV
ncbi:MAG: LacI family transcriptional regulator [Anaeroplasmataceae bacterium]|nr:LacI family transcriptional regulator [Anaeroplasmataceae bacterium]